MVKEILIYNMHVYKRLVDKFTGQFKYNILIISNKAKYRRQEK